jgi:hypothetical protein
VGGVVLGEHSEHLQSPLAKKIPYSFLTALGHLISLLNTPISFLPLTVKTATIVTSIVIAIASKHLGFTSKRFTPFNKCCRQGAHASK